MTSVVAPNPLHSVKLPWAILSSSIRKLKLRNGSTRCPVSGMFSSSPLALVVRAAFTQGETNDDELRRAHRGDAHFDDDLSEDALGRCVHLLIDLDVKGLAGASAKQRARSPDAGQELRHRTFQLLPEREV